MELPEKISKIYDLFKNYYTEERVDIIFVDPYAYIIVHWPSVTVKNENDDSIEIYDLFCKICVNTEGRIINRPLFLRSTYTENQFVAGYIHSHIRRLGSINDTVSWAGCCLGSGPILGTIRELEGLIQDEERLLNLWVLFIWELDKYVHVESLDGGPYIRLTEVLNPRANTFIKSISGIPPSNGLGIPYRYTEGLHNITSEEFNSKLNKCIKNFVKYLLHSNILKFSYNQGYIIGMSVTEYVYAVSNAFITWSNDVYKAFTTKKDKAIFKGLTKWLSQEVKFKEGYFVIEADGVSRAVKTLHDNIGKEIITFKGNKIKLRVQDDNKNIVPKVYNILNYKVLSYIAYFVLNYLNINYNPIKNITNGNK